MSAQNTLLIKYYNLLIKCYNPNYKVQGYKVECCNKVQFLNDIPQLHIRSQESFLSASCLRKLSLLINRFTIDLRALVPEKNASSLRQKSQ